MKIDENKWKRMETRKKTELKFQKKYTLSDSWNTYDPFGEAFFFAAGPFFKHPVFLILMSDLGWSAK